MSCPASVIGLRATPDGLQVLRRGSGSASQSQVRVRSHIQPSHRLSAPAPAPQRSRHPRHLGTGVGARVDTRRWQHGTAKICKYTHRSWSRCGIPHHPGRVQPRPRTIKYHTLRPATPADTCALVRITALGPQAQQLRPLPTRRTGPVDCLPHQCATHGHTAARQQHCSARGPPPNAPLPGHHTQVPTCGSRCTPPDHQFAHPNTHTLHHSHTIQKTAVQ